MLLRVGLVREDVNQRTVRYLDDAGLFTRQGAYLNRYMLEQPAPYRLQVVVATLDEILHVVSRTPPPPTV